MSTKIVYVSVARYFGILHVNEQSNEVLTLQTPISQNGQTHSNNLSENCRQIVWECLTILWDSRLKSSQVGGGAIQSKNSVHHS